MIDVYQPNHLDHPFSLEVEANHPIILGDEEKMEQVFMNLISNAVKYSPGGGPVEIKIYEEKECLKVSVKDQGLGIPAEGMEKLFTKFYRVDNSDRCQIGGTGLGLAIVKEIMKGHGGDISAESKEGKGSTFTLSFPLYEQKQSETLDAESTNEEVQKETKDGKINVLIVEDDQSHAQLLREELEESHFSVSTYRDAETALAALKVEEPNAVVVDIQLGKDKMSGWDFIEEARKTLSLKHVPFFISSATEEREKAQRLGAEEYFIKPYQPSKLSNIIFQTLTRISQEGHFLLPNETVLWDLSHKRKR